jgi:hypothetical protein
MRDTIELAREVGFETMLRKGKILGFDRDGDYTEELKAFAELVRADEREAIKDEWWMCVQSDLENGVKSLNEQAATKWRKEYPEIAKFGAWLNARGEDT